jgi:hypothetical protein
MGSVLLVLEATMTDKEVKSDEANNTITKTGLIRIAVNEIIMMTSSYALVEVKLPRFASRSAAARVPS